MNDTMNALHDNSGATENIPLAFGSATNAFITEMNQKCICQDSDGVIGIRTGFTDLDGILSGLRRGHVGIVAGRPSMGKLAFVCNIATHVATKERLPVLIFSMNRSSLRLTTLLLAQVGNINQRQLRIGKLKDSDALKLDGVLTRTKDARLYIDDTMGLDRHQIYSRGSDFCRKHGPPGLIVVDNLQQIGTRHSSNRSSRHYRKIMASLKQLAKDANVPVIATSQLDRALEKRRNKRPNQGDFPFLEIPHNADLVLFLYRDEVYHPDSGEKGRAEILIGRNRAGPIGAIRLGFNGEYSSFTNVDLVTPD